MEQPEVYQNICSKCKNSAQKRYEAIRTILLYDHSFKERATETNLHVQTLREYVKLFQSEGFDALDDKRRGKTPDKTFSMEMKQDVVWLKNSVPEITLREIQRYILNRYSYSIHTKTIKRFIESEDYSMISGSGKYQAKSSYEEGIEALKLKSYGLSFKTIAALIGKSTKTISRIWKKFIDEKSFNSLKRKERELSSQKKTFNFKNLITVLKKQVKYPDIGSWRMQSLLKRDGKIIGRTSTWKMMRFNQEHYGLKAPEQEKELRIMPLKPKFRHQYWYIDIRYLVKLDGKQIYSICLLEGYSRKILAGDVFLRQNLFTILNVLFPAFVRYGLPGTIISDNAKVFKSEKLLALLPYLGFNWHQIEKGKPWQNLIEAMFGIQKRMLDSSAGNSDTFEEVRKKHQQDFIEVYNTSEHWAHSSRNDNRKTPAEVLGWVLGKSVIQEKINIASKGVLIGRIVTNGGYTRIHNFYLFTVRGAFNLRVSVFLKEDKLTIEAESIVFAEYDCLLDKNNEVRQVTGSKINPVELPKQQLSILDHDDGYWDTAFKKTRKLHEKKKTDTFEQLELPFYFDPAG